MFFYVTVVMAHTAQIFCWRHHVVCLTNLILTFLYLLQMNPQVHSHWLCMANRLWPSHQTGECVMVAREETDSTCECASLCAKERWWGDKKTKWEENMAHKIEGSGIWRENVGKGELCFVKRSEMVSARVRWRLNKARKPLCLCKGGREVHYWLAKLPKKKRKRKLTRTGSW